MLQKLVKVGKNGISILLQLITLAKCTELHIHNVHRAVAVWCCGMIHEVTVTSSLYHE